MALGAGVSADIYIQNMRGSNNRLDEANRDRNNANRMFDSQNNNRGGVNVGSLYYPEGSKETLELAYQHGGLDANLHSDIIVQYMCDERLRDGTTTQTIPTNPNECYNWDCDTDVRFGRHESRDSYLMCEHTERNKGLFTSSQNLKGDSAKYTRQNNNGRRSGYECPEERDYYPYWGYSAWTDLYVLTSDPERCTAYARDKNADGSAKEQSFCNLESVKEGDDEPTNSWHDFVKAKTNKLVPITQAECELFEFFNGATNKTERAVWKSLGVPKQPECSTIPESRDNHLGNTVGGQYASHKITLPDYISEQCTLRVRYNISTKDFSHMTDDNQVFDLDSRNNSMNNGPANVPSLAAKYMIDVEGEMGDRGYQLKNNPNVMPFEDKDLEFQLAINTAQYGRTFQDRTHKFAIRPRPTGVSPSATIHMVNVKGKRGNIVQTYPGCEYDFTPNDLKCKVGEYVHFQWSGSNTNPNNNAGQGRQGTDRSNIVALREGLFDEPEPVSWGGQKVVGKYGRSYPAYITNEKKGNEKAFLGLSNEDLRVLAIQDNYHLGGELSELDDLGTYFDMAPRKCTEKGVFHYMSTRNNNFSNRSQKGKITISNRASVDFPVSADMGATISTGAFEAKISPGSLSQSQMLTLTSETKTDLTSAASDVVSIMPADLKLRTGRTVQVSVGYKLKGMQKPKLMQATTADGPWSPVEGATFEDEVITGDVSKGGFYVVLGVTNIGAVFGIVFAALAVVALAAFIVYRIKNKPQIKLARQI